MKEENFTIGIAEQKPKATYGCAMYFKPKKWHAAFTYMVEMHAQPSVNIDELLASEMIPNLAQEDRQKAYQDLVLNLIFSGDPIIIPDYLSVESADYLLNHGPEIIGKMIDSRFWIAKIEEGGLPTVEPVSEDVYYIEVRIPQLVNIFPDFLTIRPQYYRELVGGSLEKIVR